VASKGNSSQKINSAVNAKVGDIVTAAKSLAQPASYENGGWPAHNSLHINKGGTKSRATEGKVK